MTACQGALAQDDDGDKRYADDKMEGSLYPYGPIHRIDRCWDKHAHHGYRPVYTGQHPGCVTADGVYDMTGNVAEWVVDAKGRQMLMGGAFDSKADKATVMNTATSGAKDTLRSRRAFGAVRMDSKR